MHIRIIALCLLLCFSASCTMAPKYERPAAPVPKNFPDYPEYQGIGHEAPDKDKDSAAQKAWSDGNMGVTGGADAKATDETPAPDLVPWQQFFTDSRMQRIISQALQNNRDLRIALLNIEKARAMYRIQRADLLPSISANGQNSNQLISPDAPQGIAGKPFISRQSAVSVGFTSFELDLFGRIRSLNEAALQTYFATAQNAHAAQISLVSEVASTFLQLISYKELYGLTESAYQSRKKTYDLTQVQFSEGVASQLILNQAKAAMEEARVTAVQYKTQILIYENALALLMGGPMPDHLVIPSKLADLTPLKAVPAGLPSNMLERRPDILAAEHSLQSANANIGAARANFFPRISLTGSLGYLSTDMSDLFMGDSRMWSFAPSVSLPLFEGGRNLANLEASEVDKRIAVTTYEKTIQSAFREVADALAQRSTVSEQLAATKSLMDATKQSYDIALERYNVGIDSFMNVLDSQRTYFSAQQSYVNAVLLREINTLTLYKTLGGGWR